MTTLAHPVSRAVKVRGYANRSIVITLEPLEGGDALIRLREKGCRKGEQKISAYALFMRLAAGK